MSEQFAYKPAAEAAKEDGGFVVGFPGRHDAAAGALAGRRGAAPAGFSPAELIRRIEEAFGGGPKHFAPADPAVDPTEGWNPLDPDAAPNAFIDPLEAAHGAGYTEGFAAAQAQLEEAAARDRALLRQLADALGAAHGVDRGALAARLRATVVALVQQVVGEVGVSAELLAARVEAATDLLAEATESALLRVHPDDVALLGGKLPDSIFAVGDAEVARGSFVLESASTIVEDGPALWLEQLSSAIDRVALPGVPGAC